MKNLLNLSFDIGRSCSWTLIYLFDDRPLDHLLPILFSTGGLNALAGVLVNILTAGEVDRGHVSVQRHSSD